MAKIKSYTDIEQSKKLAGFLPLESADMYYDGFGRLPQGYAYTLTSPNSFEYDSPCWSLAALINVLPSAILDISNEHDCKIRCMKVHTAWYNNAVDACYIMIIKLHALNLL